jgi:hypothetical protein
MAAFDAQGASRLRVVTAVVRQAGSVQHFLGGGESVLQEGSSPFGLARRRDGSVVCGGRQAQRGEHLWLVGEVADQHLHRKR